MSTQLDDRFKTVNDFMKNVVVFPTACGSFLRSIVWIDPLGCLGIFDVYTGQNLFSLQVTVNYVSSLALIFVWSVRVHIIFEYMKL